MIGIRSSLSRRGLLVLIMGVTVIPLATLVWLGWRLFEQDRALDAQRLDRSVDGVVAALQRSLATWEEQLAAGTSDIPDGAVRVTIQGGSVLVTPRSSVAFLPEAPPLPEPPPTAFAAADVAEFVTKDARAAAVLFETLSRSADRATRAEALLRLGRTQQDIGQTNAALATYHALLTIDDVGIEGMPASLIGRYQRCGLFEARGRQADLAAEAAALLADLHAARWPLSAAVYWLYLKDATRWTGAASMPLRDEERLALAVVAFHEKWAAMPQGDPAFRRDVVNVAGEIVTALWHATPQGTTVLVAMPTFVRRHWLTAAEEVARQEQIVLTVGDTTPASVTSTGITRSPAETGLPWALSIAPADPVARQAEFVLRRRLLGTGFVLIVTMALAAGVLIVRAVSREVAVARLQSDFVAAVSHEFRTPLTTLRQFTDRLRENTTLTDERRWVCYDAQLRATDRLTRLVESLLDFGRMEAGRRPYTFAPHDVTALVGTVVDDFRPDALAAGHDVRFRGNGALPIPADREALSRAIWNLLDNAVKYSPGANVIDVDIGRQDDDVVISVRDYGLGVPASERSAIFTKFQRGAEAQARGITGTGLGLAMVDLIVKAHHGQIDLESQPGRGSTFKIRLPVDVSSGRAADLTT